MISSEEQAIVHPFLEIKMAQCRLCDRKFQIRTDEKGQNAADISNFGAHQDLCEGIRTSQSSAVKPVDPIGDALQSLPIIGVINVDNPCDPRHKEWDDGK